MNKALGILKRYFEQIVWVGALIGTFLIDTPKWSESSTIKVVSYTEYIKFLGSIVSAIFLIFTLKSSKIYHWKKYSLLFLTLSIFSFAGYAWFAQTKTLPYEKDLIIIGNEFEPNNPLEKIKKTTNRRYNKEEWLMVVHGRAELIWTKSSIRFNAIVILLLYTFCYILTMLLIVSTACALKISKMFEEM